MRPMRPTLTTAPLSTADAGTGAAEWASGIQTCNGKSPALSPNPAISSASAAAPQGDPGSAAMTSRMSRLPSAAAASRTKPMSTAVSPASESPTYIDPAYQARGVPSWTTSPPAPRLSRASAQ